jgi:hypothetical protein
MVLPSENNPISLGQIQTEFGGSDPISVTEYYRSGSYVSGSGNATIPTSGGLSLSNFYGKRKAVYGCNTPGYENFNPNVTDNDGSCYNPPTPPPDQGGGGGDGGGGGGGGDGGGGGGGGGGEPTPAPTVNGYFYYDGDGSERRVSVFILGVNTTFEENLAGRTWSYAVSGDFGGSGTFGGGAGYTKFELPFPHPSGAATAVISSPGYNTYVYTLWFSQFPF